MATTRDYTDYLNDQVDIAPVNSQEELQASEIVESLFVQHGLETHVEEFDAPILASLSTRIYMIILFLGILLSGFLGTPVSVVGLVLVAVSFVLLALARNDNDVLAAIGPQARSQNVVGVHHATGPNVVKGNRPIVIVAHYDTPRENFLYNKQFAKWQPIIKRLAWPLSIAVLVLTLMQVVPFLPVVVRRVFWVLGVLAALPLLLLGASSVYERFAPCTTGANDNKASMAALLGVLDMVRPGPDDAKRWAATHPKSVRRSLEEELEDEIYGDEWDEDEEYADEDTFDDDAEGYADENRYRYEDEVEEGGYIDEELDGEDVFDEEEAYDDESFVDESAISEEDEYAGYEDEEPFADDEADEEYLDDEYFEDEEVEEEPTSAQRVYRPVAVGTGLVDEYGLETPSTVRRGVSVLESLQVLPETCEIVYENLIPRDEAIDRIEGVVEQADEIVEVAEKGSEALERVKGVAGGVGKAILGALFAARDWAQRVFDWIGELFVSVKERFGKDHNLPEIDKAGEAPTASAAYDAQAEDYVEEYLDEDAGVEDEYLESDIDSDYIETEGDEDYLEDATDEEYLDDAIDEDYPEDVDGEGYLEEDEYLEDEEPYDAGVVEELIDEVEEETGYKSAPVIEPISMPAFSDYDAISEEYVQERAADTPSVSVGESATEEEASEPADSDDEERFVGDLAAESFQEEVDEAEPFQEEVAEDFAQQETGVFDIYVPEDKYRKEAIFDTADIPLASYELIDEEEDEVQDEAVADELIDEDVADIYDEQEIPELETDYVNESEFSDESTGQLPRVSAAATEVAEEDEEIDAIADAEAAVASLWVPSEPVAETDVESAEMDYVPLDEPVDVELPESKPSEAPSAFDVSTVAPVDEAVEEELEEPEEPEEPEELEELEELEEPEELTSEVDDIEVTPASMYDAPETSMVEITLDEPEDMESNIEQPVDEATSASYIYDEEPLVVTAPEVADDSDIRSASYDEIGDTQSNEVIDADPWGPYLDVMDAEYELLDDEPDDLVNDSVPVEVVDVPSMGLGYEIPGLTPTDELFAHEEAVVAPASEWDTASISPIEDDEYVAADAYQSADSLLDEPEDTYEPVAEAAPTRLWTPAPEESLEESAIDEIFEAVVKDATEQTDSVAPIAASVATTQVTTPSEEDASSILHAMFATAPEQEHIEMPKTSDVLHEMFATRPYIEPEQPVLTEEPVEFDESSDEYDQIPEAQSEVDEYPLPLHDAEVEEEPVAEEAVAPAVEEEPTAEEAAALAVEEVEEFEPEPLDEQLNEPEPFVMEDADTFGAVDEPEEELFEIIEEEQIEEPPVWDAESEQQDEGEAVDTQPETAIEFEEDHSEAEIDEEPFDFEPEPQSADDLEPEVDLEESFGQTDDAVDDVELDSQQAETAAPEVEPVEDFMSEIAPDEVVEEAEIPAEAIESIPEPEELPTEEVVEDLVEDEVQPLVAEEPEQFEQVEAASDDIEAEPEFAEVPEQEEDEPADTQDFAEELSEDVTSAPEVEEEETVEQKADPYATQLMTGLVFSNEEDVSEEELADKDVTGLTMISEEAEADVEAYLPAEDDRIPRPRAVDDPDWGKTNFKPATVSVGRRAMLLDLPDPSVMAVDPLDAGQSGNIARGSATASRTQEAVSAGRSAEAQRRLDALRRVPSPLDEPTNVPAAPDPGVEQPEAKPAAKPAAEEPELPKYNKRKSIDSRTPKKNAKRKMRFGLRRKNAPEQVESMGEWLGLDDDYDAKKDGRQIGSWDNFDDNDNQGKWKGGATYRAGLRDEYSDDSDATLDDSRYDEYDMAPDYAAEDGSMMDEAEQSTLDDESMTELREAVLRLGDDDIIAHDVWFVGVGASTLDHAGMRAFLDEHRRDIRGAFLVNIDSVGAGDLKVLTSEGMGNKRRSDRRMVRMFSNIAEALHIDLGRADYSWEETDATPAMQRSVRVNTLMGMSTDGVAAHSHTSNDEPEYLDDQQIANVADLIAELIRRS